MRQARKPKQTVYRLTKQKYLTVEEYEHLMGMCRKPKPEDKRDAILFRLALATGARAGELLQTTWDDVNPKDQTILIRGTKGSDDREIPLEVGLFADLMSLFHDGEKIFNINYNRLGDIWRMWRPAKKGFHSLRHTFALRLFERTRDIHLIQVALGHRNINNTMIYAQYIYSKEEMRRLLI